MNKCLKCGEEIESDDNFCHECGHWTSRGYKLIQNGEIEKIIKGKVSKQRDRHAYLFSLLFFCVFAVIAMTLYKGKNLLKPFVYLKRQTMKYEYGYNTTVLKTDNKYFNIAINNTNEAKKLIHNDFSNQAWQCKNNAEVDNIEREIEEKLDIPSVKLCDIPVEKVKEIKNVIFDVYKLFPNIKGYLTNISVTNDQNKNNYVAYFQPIYEFANSTSDINKYNKVNKTQILLNSYYFVNDNELDIKLKDNRYVKDSSLTSMIAHEIGHYITFVSLLKSMDIKDVTLVTKDNEDIVKEITKIVNEETYSKNLVLEAISKYNNLYKTNITVSEFAQNISNYANTNNEQGEIIYGEIIAEAVHDYYLHHSSATKESLQIINTLNSKLN